MRALCSSRHGHIKVCGQRHNRRGRSINDRDLKRWSIEDEDFGPYWTAYKSWVRRNRHETIEVSPRFTLSQCADNRGFLYMVVLSFHDNGTIPSWFPTFDETPASRRNVLHMSICFTGDLGYLDELEELFACLIIADLFDDPNWTTETHSTYIVKCQEESGTFHLAGFDNDVRLIWLHKRGHYKKRQFGHIALYQGGLHR